MDDVEGQHRLVAVGEPLFLKIQILCSHAQDEDDPAPPADAHHGFKEHKC